MDISREKAAGSGDASIRLRYNRQFQSGGHTHAIDAEVALPVGASQELREQMIRDLEMGVEQLAQQIQQRNTRPTENPRSQTPMGSRATSSTPAASRPAYTERETEQRQAARVTAPGIRTPVEESMPDNPASGNEGNPIKLPVFINAIKKHLDLSPQEAMRLLQVDTLDGLNFRKAYSDLQQIVGQRNTERSGTQPPTRNQQPAPSHDAPYQTHRTAPLPAVHPPQNETPVPHRNAQAPTQGLNAFQAVARATATNGQERSRQIESETVGDLAGLPRAPIPIQFGVVRENTAPSYKFEEEDEDEFEEEDEEEEDEEGFDLPAEKPHGQQSAQLMLDNLKEIRGNNLASSERLIALNNVIGEQISEAQLQKLLQTSWGITTRKKLKSAQIEKLISWAKEDFFVEEVEAILALITEGEK